MTMPSLSRSSWVGMSLDDLMACIGGGGRDRKFAIHGDSLSSSQLLNMSEPVKEKVEEQTQGNAEEVYRE